MVERPALSARRRGFVRGLVLGACTLAISVGACNDGPALPDEHLGRAASALEPEVVAFELSYPAGASLDQAVIGVSASLDLGPDDVVFGIDGSPGTVTNAGNASADKTTSGPGSRLGAIISIPTIVLGPRVVATSVTSGATVTAGPNASLGAITEHAELKPVVRKAFFAHASGERHADVTVRPNGSSVLTPGRYRGITVGPGATLSLSAGTYFVEQLTIGKNATMKLDGTSGTIGVYVAQSATLGGTTVGDATRFLLALTGGGELTLSGGFRGTALAPSGTLILGSGGEYEGTFYGKRVVVGPHVTVRKLALPSFDSDLEGCAARVPLRTELPPAERGVAYQADVARLCSAPGISNCKAQLIGRANVDYTAAASRMITRNFLPAQYLALSQDRSHKLQRAEEDLVIATRICTGTDSDGDWVVDALDRCPDTPDLTATDDDGCPTALPAAPSADDVARLIASMNLIVNPLCRDAPMPGKVPAGAFYWLGYPSRGSYILSGAVQNQRPGCPVWYEFDIEEISGKEVGYRYAVVFMDREANPNLVELGRPVPEGFIQFNPHPGDVAGRNRLATSGGRAGIRYRVRAMNANGIRGPWSDFKVSDRASCTALGFECRP